ncbi:MAG: DUF58 domain-containing protein [Mariprofundales bacterium]|nr:DUF58 domain-containing protein [Mariprofundales bacterium]
MLESPTSISLPSLIQLEQRAAALQLLSGSIRSPLTGGHLSRLRGRGMEFDEVRRYQTGDDARTIDWRVTARKGSPYIKLFREERERPILLCIDYRQSMFFATRGALKSVVASTIAALYGWAGVAHGDRVGGLLFDDNSLWEQRPAKGRRALLRLLHLCCKHESWQQQKLKAAALRRESVAKILLRLRRVTPSGSLVVIVSDGRGFNEQCEAYLAPLARHSSVVFLHITDPLERRLPQSGIYPIDDGNGVILFDGRNLTLRQRYEQQYQQRRFALQQRCHHLGVHWIDISTSDDLLHRLDASGQVRAPGS